MSKNGFVLPLVLVAAVGLAIAGAAVYSQIKLNVTQPPQPLQETNHESPSLNQTPVPSPTATAKSIIDKVTGVLSIQEVNSNKDAYVGKQISVRGKIYVRHNYSLMPCNANDPETCNPEIGDPTLHLVNPDSSSITPSGGQILDLYRSGSGGKYEPVTCKTVNQNTVDCGKYQQNEVTVIEGIFTRDKIPYQQVGDSAGNIKTLKYQDIYFLVIE